MGTLCPIGVLALNLGVSISTLRRWHAAGALVPSVARSGGRAPSCPSLGGIPHSSVSNRSSVVLNLL